MLNNHTLWTFQEALDGHCGAEDIGRPKPTNEPFEGPFANEPFEGGFGEEVESDRRAPKNETDIDDPDAPEPPATDADAHAAWVRARLRKLARPLSKRALDELASGQLSTNAAISLLSKTASMVSKASVAERADASKSAWTPEMRSAVLAAIPWIGAERLSYSGGPNDPNAETRPGWLGGAATTRIEGGKTGPIAGPPAPAADRPGHDIVDVEPKAPAPAAGPTTTDIVDAVLKAPPAAWKVPDPFTDAAAARAGAALRQKVESSTKPADPV